MIYRLAIYRRCHGDAGAKNVARERRDAGAGAACPESPSGLAEQPQHGYQLRKTLATRSQHYFQFAFGRLYPLLASMEQRALVTSRILNAGKARERRNFTITAKGLAELRLRKRKWRQFSEAMSRILKT